MVVHWIGPALSSSHFALRGNIRAMLWRARNSRGRPKNAPTEFTQPAGPFLRYLVSMLALFLSIATNAHADCVCRCVNGRMEPLCSSVVDMRPFCPPSTLCPTATPPTLAPPDLRIAPPVGTRRCFQRQVFNPNSGQYECKEFAASRLTSVS